MPTFPELPYLENQKHFRATSGCALWFGVIAGVLGLPWFLSGGFVLTAISVGLLAYHFVTRPPGPESVDRSTRLLVAFATGEAKRKLLVEGVDEEIPAIEVWGYTRVAFEGSGPVQVRATEGTFRTSVLSLFVARFGREQMHIYTFAASLTTEGAFNEKTVEFFYRDVVSLATETGPQGTTLTLSTTNGEKYVCPVKDAGHLDSEVATARELIRAKRS